MADGQWKDESAYLVLSRRRGRTPESLDEDCSRGGERANQEAARQEGKGREGEREHTHTDTCGRASSGGRGTARDKCVRRLRLQQRDCTLQVRVCVRSLSRLTHSLACSAIAAASSMASPRACCSLDQVSLPKRVGRYVPARMCVCECLVVPPSVCERARGREGARDRASGDE